MSPPRRAPPSIETAPADAAVKVGAAAELSLAREMIAVHGTDAATVARNNARIEALSGEGARAKFWIRVLGIIQQDGKAPRATEGHG